MRHCIHGRSEKQICGQCNELIAQRCRHGYVRQSNGTLPCEDCKEINALKDKLAARKWISLTDDEMESCVQQADYNQGQYKRTAYLAHMATAIEAKLKEKNA